MKLSGSFKANLGCLKLVILFVLLPLCVVFFLSYHLRVFIDFLDTNLSDTYFYIALVGISVVFFLFMYGIEKFKFPMDKEDDEETILAIGKILYKNQFTQFKKYLKTHNEERLIDKLFYFGEKHNLNYNVDYKGEYNEGDIIDYIEKKVNKKIVWKNVFEEYKKVPEEKRYGSDFILDLFKAISLDLVNENLKLILFELGNDAFEIGVVSVEDFKEIEKLNQLSIAPIEKAYQ